MDWIRERLSLRLKTSYSNHWSCCSTRSLNTSHPRRCSMSKKINLRVLCPSLTFTHYGKDLLTAIRFNLQTPKGKKISGYLPSHCFQIPTQFYRRPNTFTQLSLLKWKWSINHVKTHQTISMNMSDFLTFTITNRIALALIANIVIAGSTLGAKSKSTS